MEASQRVYPSCWSSTCAFGIEILHLVENLPDPLAPSYRLKTSKANLWNMALEQAGGFGDFSGAGGETRRGMSFDGQRDTTLPTNLTFVHHDCPSGMKW